MSSDKTVAIIDGSGVLHDPAGINREELIRLAKLRKPVAFFDKSKLSKDGYLVKVEEQDGGQEGLKLNPAPTGAGGAGRAPPEEDSVIEDGEVKSASGAKEAAAGATT